MTSRSIVRPFAGALAVLAAVAACQSTPPPATAGNPTAGATVAPSPAGASASADAPASPGGPASPAPSGIAAREVSGITGVLPPGRYTRRGFEPRVTFEVDGPWRSVQTLVGFFDIQQQVGSPDVIAVQFAKPDGIVGANDAVVRATTAEAAIAAVRQNSGIVVVESSQSRIAGLDGLQVTVENPATQAGDHAVLRLQAGPLGISPARRLWMAFFDTPDGLLAILVGGSVATWDEALATAEPVLESITIGE